MPIAALCLHLDDRKDEPPFIGADVAPPDDERVQAEIGPQLQRSRIGEGHGDGHPRLRIGSTERMIRIASRRETGGDQDCGTHTHRVSRTHLIPHHWCSRQRGPGPPPPPPLGPPPAPGPKAWYAKTNPATATPVSNTTLLRDTCRCSTPRTNSPGTTTVSPAQRAMSPRRDSTASTARARPRSVAARYRPRTTSALGPR